MDQRDEAPVLIAGGGLIGLSSAMFLAQHGVRSLVIERLNSVSRLPRAAFFHMRTLELFRSAGIEERVREGSRKDFVPEGALVSLESVAGKKLADIIGNLNENVDEISPCRRLFLNQPNLEPILAARAEEGGATLLRGLEVTGLSQDQNGVTLIARNAAKGEERRFRGKYLIAADGAHSKVRESLGIAYDGRGVFSNSITIYFTADLSPYIRDNAWSIIYVNNKNISGFFRMNRANTSGFLVVNAIGDATVDPIAASNAAADISEATLIEYIRAGVGDPNLKVAIDGVSRWRATADVARSYRSGRVFVAGDAAHLMPPNGGFGGNTGIHDAHNLAWKLALVSKGQAGDALLDTYETERQPVGKFTVEQAFTRYVLRTAPWLKATQEIDAAAHDFEIEVGYLYESPAIVTEPSAFEGHADPRETLGLPGSRAPHVWLMHGGKRLSTLDLFHNFTLIAGSKGATWINTAKDAAKSMNVALDAYRIGAEIQDDNGRLAQAFGIDDAGATLVRPDGFVAWRSVTKQEHPESVLKDVLHRILDAK